MRNEQVIREWTLGRSAKSSTGNLSTDGENLFSYNLLIGSRSRKVVFDYTSSGTFYSMTTSCHVGRAAGGSGYKIVTPL